MVKPLKLVRQKRNLEQDLIIAKVHIDHSSVFMNIMGNYGQHNVSQQRFYEHYGQHNHSGIDDWQFTLIEQCKTHEQLKEIVINRFV